MLNETPDLDRELARFDSPSLEEILSSFPPIGTFHCPIPPYMQNLFIADRLNQNCQSELGPVNIEWSNVRCLPPHEVSYGLYITQLNALDRITVLTSEVALLQALHEEIGNSPVMRSCGDILGATIQPTSGPGESSRTSHPGGMHEIGVIAVFCFCWSLNSPEIALVVF